MLAASHLAASEHGPVSPAQACRFIHARPKASPVRVRFGACNRHACCWACSLAFTTKHAHCALHGIAVGAPHARAQGCGRREGHLLGGGGVWTAVQTLSHVGAQVLLQLLMSCSRPRDCTEGGTHPLGACGKVHQHISVRRAHGRTTTLLSHTMHAPTTAATCASAC